MGWMSIIRLYKEIKDKIKTQKSWEKEQEF